MVQQIGRQLGFDPVDMEGNIWRESLDSLMLNQAAMQDTTRPRLFVLDPADERDDELNAKTTKFVALLKACRETKLYPIVCICNSSYKLPFKDLATNKNIYMYLPRAAELRDYLKFQLGPFVKVANYMDWKSPLDLWTLNKRINDWHEGSDFSFAKTDHVMDLLLRKPQDLPPMAEFLRCLDGTDMDLLLARMFANYAYYVNKPNLAGLEWVADQFSEADVQRFSEEPEVSVILQTRATVEECTALKNQIVRPANKGQEYFGVPFAYPEPRKKAPASRVKLDDAACFFGPGRFKY